MATASLFTARRTKACSTSTSGRYAGKIYVSLDQAGFDKVHVLNGGIEAFTGELSKEATVLPASDLKLTEAKPVIVNKDHKGRRSGARRSTARARRARHEGL